MKVGETPVILVEVNNAQTKLPIDETRLIAAVRSVLTGEGIAQAHVSLAIVDAATMHELNRRHLSHDYPTDVLSFLLGQSDNQLEGEIIVSADEAALNAPKFHWSPEAELTLYVIHGALHLCGHDDLNEQAADVMRARECHWLVANGFAPPTEVRRASVPTSAHAASEARP